MRKASGRILLFLFFLLSAFLQTPGMSQNSDLNPNALARLIHNRRGNWIALKADLRLEFLTPQGKKITCRGKLVYHRLDEKIRLKGFNDKQELLFAFKTFDRNFELYLPLLAEDYQGSIFDLEDSPEIQSHLKALDLYRALKPGVIPVERMSATLEKDGGVLIKITKGKSGPALSRELTASRKGDVSREVFYSTDGTPATEIRRSDFKEIKNKQSPAAVFPFRIEIEVYSKSAPAAGTKKTILIFDRLELLSEIQDSEFALSVPEKTRRVNLES